MSSLLKGAIKLFHGAVKDFDSFDSKFATETAFGKGFSFTPDKKIAKDYAEITPSKIKKLWGKEHVEAALERKKDGIPILYEVEASIRTNELLLARKNFESQNKQVKAKLNKLIKEEKIDKNNLDLDKPKFWRQLVKESGKDADALFTKYGIKAVLKDATESKLKQVGGTLEYTVFDPKVLDIKDKVFLQEKRMSKKSMLEREPKQGGGELIGQAAGGVGATVQGAVGVANKAVDLTQDYIDNQGGFGHRVGSGKNLRTGVRIAQDISDVVTDPVGTTKKLVIDKGKKAIGSGINKLVGRWKKRRKKKGEEEEEEATQAFSIGGKVLHLADRLAGKATTAAKDAFLKRDFLRDISTDPEFDEAINDLPEADYKQLMDEIGFDYDMGTGALSSNLGRAQNLDPEMAAKNYMDFGSFDNIRDYLVTRSPNEIRTFIETLEDNAVSEADDRVIVAAERILKEMTQLRVKKAEGGMENRAENLKMELAKEDLDMAHQGRLSSQEQETLGMFPTQGQVLQFREMQKLKEQRRQQETVDQSRMGQAEGGMPVDTYPNIPPEEMDEAMASQLPDEEMEDSYIDFVMDESLNDDDKEYLAMKLEEDPRLSEIMDSIVLTAGEFSGAGEVEGPGTGVSDSIPARLSDGEFVVTKKATDQIGADNLQQMMDNAERAYDGGYQKKAIGGYTIDDPEKSEVASPKTMDEEIKKAMIASSKIPSLQ